MRGIHGWSRAVLLLVGVTACGGAKRDALPPPVYERPSLPEWQPPAPPEEEDPIGDLTEMDGEWVVDEGSDEAQESTGSDAESDEGGSIGASDGSDTSPDGTSPAVDSSGESQESAESDASDPSEDAKNGTK